jgi:hypothetical protein
MNEGKERREGDMNARPLNESIAGTAPGIPDEARAPGEELPQPPSDEEVERVARLLGVEKALKKE